MFRSINPFTGQKLKTFEACSAEEVDRKLEESWRAFRAHRQSSYKERASKLMRAAEILESGKARWAAIITAEMGKTIASAEAEVAKCALGCRYYADTGESALADEIAATGAKRSFIRYQPLGPILAIMPWNFPFWQVFRFAAPALMAGNTALLKHAPSVPQCALAIEEIFLEAGFALGVFQSLFIEVDEVKRVIRDERVRAVTLTGSERAGREVGEQAGREIKKVVLELGGSDPFLIMPSADLEQAIATAVKSRTINNGQSCIAAKRFIIDKSIYAQCEEKFVERMRALRIGDPSCASTDIGPLVSEEALARLDDQVRRAVASGAQVLAGGKVYKGQRCTYEPTVLARVPRDSAVYREEFFGPVAMLFSARDRAEAIEIANDTPFGLGASVWTRDESEISEFVNEIEAGQVFVNSMVASDPRVPFGGVKHSGHGRELGAVGIREFVNSKTVWIA